ncbi:hypothetical protein WN944_016072 [Citrus x changshan-huyou]|uniref:Uncharacterized protein n=1 Tax=Citrus x changshan-huyou TaxID=2935761 RepID=A0AAP0M8P2_9ROSI
MQDGLKFGPAAGGFVAAGSIIQEFKARKSSLLKPLPWVLITNVTLCLRVEIPWLYGYKNGR